MQESNLTVVGTVVADPKFSLTKTGVAFCSIRVAVNERRFDKEANNWVDSGTTFFNVLAWRFLAENIAESISKGDPIIANGKLRVREWKTEDRNGIAVELEAVAIGLDLNRGTAQFTKNRRSPNSEWEASSGQIAS